MKKITITLLSAMIMILMTLPCEERVRFDLSEDPMSHRIEAETVREYIETVAHGVPPEWVGEAFHTDLPCTNPECPDPNKGSETREVAALGHVWGAWSKMTAATVFAGGTNVQYCIRCNAANYASTAAVTPYVSWAKKVSKIPRKSKAAFSVNLANGDYVTKWKSSSKLLLY